MIDEFPIQVTKTLFRPCDAQKYTDPLQKQGYKTFLRAFDVTIKGNKKPAWALFRSLSEKEQKEITAGKYFLRNGAMLFNEKKSLHKEKVSCICPSCEAPFESFGADPRKLCPRCRRMAENLSGYRDNMFPKDKSNPRKAVR